MDEKAAADAFRELHMARLGRPDSRKHALHDARQALLLGADVNDVFDLLDAYEASLLPGWAERRTA